MNIAGVFIRRPVATTLIMVGIIIFGVMGYRQLPVSDLPNVDYPTISVSASLPGATPDVMASSVATPLERQFSTIAGIDSMSSVNAQGSTQITLQFSLERNIDSASQDVQSAIAQAARQLPPELPNPPSSRKVNPADSPVIFLALSSPVLPLSQVDEYAETNIAERISMISGVAQVVVYGSQKYAVRVRVNPKELATRGIGIDEVSDAIESGNSNIPTGQLSGPLRTLTIQAAGQLSDAAAYKNLIVKYQNGTPVRLGQISNVIDSVEDDKQASWFTKDRAVILAVQRQPGTNTVEVVANIKKLLPNFRAQLPASVNMDILFDRSESIRSSVADVKFTLILAIALVVMVIFLFLRSVAATLIPSLAIPMSIVGTFAVMYMLGYSLDNLSLMALTLAVGFVVDDAVVMLENIVRHIEMGKTPYEAALKGSEEIGFTIISMTLSLIAVFIPIVFMAGILGRLLNEFAITIIIAIAVSSFVSLTLTPMLCSRFLHSSHDIKHGRIYRASEAVFNFFLNIYASTLRVVLRHRFITLIFSILLLFATVWLFKLVPTGFIPSEDTGQISGNTKALQGISFDSMIEHQQALAAIVRADPNVDAFMSSVGGGGSVSASNTGRFFIRLKPRDQRKLSADQIIQELRPKLAKVPGIQVFLQNPPAIKIGGRSGNALYQFSLQGPDTKELYKVADQVQDKLTSLTDLQDVSSDLQINNPEVRVDIDRDKAAVLGITLEQIQNALYDSYGSRQISTIFTSNDEYEVIMELDPRYQKSLNAISLLYVRSSNGNLVPMSTLATLHEDAGPLLVNHTGQLPSVTISFNLKPGVSLGTAVAQIQEATRPLLPASITSSFQGTAQAFQASFANLWMLLAAAIIVIYIVLGVLYESFIHPITILSGLPSAGLGALATLLLFHDELNIFSFVGIIMLVGIVKKNAIMMIDFALELERNENKSPAEAIYEGCLIRFRPIMMTTMAALMATLPIAMGVGAGAESRRPLGLAVVGGLMVSQLLTLYITPVIYIYLDKIQNKLSRRKAPKHKAAIPETT